MADYHFVYKDVEGASTEWDDIQRRLGNLPPKPEPFKPPPFAPKVDADEQPKSKEWLDVREPEELEELEDDLDDDRFLEKYRKMRLAELREAAKAARFGTILPITGSDFVREVSQAQSDVWVVVFLYKDGIVWKNWLLGIQRRSLLKLSPQTASPTTQIGMFLQYWCITTVLSKGLMLVCRSLVERDAHLNLLR
ncbi:Thioredoxin superfamily protein [Zea mays]|uniref:Thioredoxin superfamily protein n=1 Tax=Zea mays TaxID=4577 RepID=A0A1D6LKJ0_MAIZE|nr:Thioredoxin superfamily protein [Zea mays]